jgi:hypothetical protein
MQAKRLCAWQWNQVTLDFRGFLSPRKQSQDIFLIKQSYTQTVFLVCVSFVIDNYSAITPDQSTVYQLSA